MVSPKTPLNDGFVVKRMFKSMKLLIPFLLVSFAGFSLNMQSPQPHPQFFRLINVDEKTAFQLAHKIYRNSETGLTISLLSGQHFAKKEFYDRHVEIMKASTHALYEGKGLAKRACNFPAKIC